MSGRSLFRSIINEDRAMDRDDGDWTAEGAADPLEGIVKDENGFYVKGHSRPDRTGTA